jgi:hypothetical protein
MQNALYTLDLHYNDEDAHHGHQHLKLIFDTKSQILLRDDVSKHLYVCVGCTNYPTVPLHTALSGHFMHKAFYVDKTLANVCEYKKQFLDCYANTVFEIKKLELDNLTHSQSALPESTFLEKVKILFSYNNVNLDKHAMVMQQELLFLRLDLPLH